MNRREIVRLIAAAGLGTAIYRPLWGAREEFAECHLISAWPDADLARLRRIHSGDLRVTRRSIQPCRQDLTMLTRRGLLDPATANLPRGLADLALEMRSRPAPGGYLLSVQDGLHASEDLVIEVEGRVVEIVDLNRDYDSIHVSGACGQTHLSLQNGLVSVKRASCRHKNCQRIDGVRAGKIICAPNRLVAHVAGRTGHLTLDAITG